MVKAVVSIVMVICNVERFLKKSDSFAVCSPRRMPMIFHAVMAVATAVT
jgi:hypothetical protein